jgi:hypothetical protein
MFLKSAKLLLISAIFASSTGVGFAQDASKPADATPTEIIRSIVQDPAIKNYVGPSENAWDFTNPNTIPGFGPIASPGDAR